MPWINFVKEETLTTDSTTMLSLIGDTLTELLSWIGEVVTSLTSSTGALHDLLPLLVIGVTVSVFMLAVRAIKTFIWGA